MYTVVKTRSMALMSSFETAENMSFETWIAATRLKIRHPMLRQVMKLVECERTPC